MVPCCAPLLEGRDAGAHCGGTRSPREGTRWGLRAGACSSHNTSGRQGRQTCPVPTPISGPIPPPGEILGMVDRRARVYPSNGTSPRGHDPGAPSRVVAGIHRFVHLLTDASGCGSLPSRADRRAAPEGGLGATRENPFVESHRFVVERNQGHLLDGRVQRPERVDGDPGGQFSGEAVHPG